MERPFYNRRMFVASTGAALATGVLPTGGLVAPAHAANFAQTQTMPGGSNNYRPNAPLVESLGSGFTTSGVVRKAGTGEPLAGVRIQIWAATTLGGEREPRNHGSVLTAADGSFTLEMEQIIPNFGEPHAHLAYDDADYKTVFLRPVMASARDTSLQVNFNLAPA